MRRTDFSEDSEDTQHTPQERLAAATRSTWVSVGVNLVLTAIQVVAGVWSQSQALVADGIHSLSDLVADFVVLIAGHHAKKDADADHPYGHHRFETGASMVIGLLLLAVGLGMLWSAAQKLQDPGNVAPVHVLALWVVGGTLLTKEWLFRYMLGVAKRVKSTLLVANAWHARSDAASSLVVGVGIVGNLMGYPILDPIAALIVGAMVTKMGWDFTWDALHDLMDRAVENEEVAAIRATLLGTPGVLDVHDLRTRKLGDMVAVDVHLEVDGDLTVRQGHDIAVLARDRVLKHHRVLNLMTHVDPWRRPDLDHAHVVLPPASQGARFRPPKVSPAPTAIRPSGSANSTPNPMSKREPSQTVRVLVPADEVDAARRALADFDGGALTLPDDATGSGPDEAAPPDESTRPVGPAWRWTTPVWLDGTLEADTLRGQLVIQGRGDPKLTPERLPALLPLALETGFERLPDHARERIVVRTSFAAKLPGRAASSSWSARPPTS